MEQTELKETLGMIVKFFDLIICVSAHTEMNVGPLPEYNSAQPCDEEDLHRLQVEIEGQKRMLIKSLYIWR